MMNFVNEKKHILLVDDDPEILEIMNHYLESEGYSTDRCYSPDEAIELLKSKQAYDLVISDYEMNSGTGLDIYEFLHEQICAPPFLLISGVVSSSILDSTSDSDAFLSKPFSANTFIEKVRLKLRISHKGDSVDDDNFLKEILESFKEEATELLEGVDEKIMSLELQQSEATLDDLFRRVHSLKGSSASLPRGALMSSLAHEFEAVLVDLKSKKIQMDSSLSDILLASTDLLKVLLSFVAYEKEAPASISSKVHHLLKFYKEKNYGAFKNASNDDATKELEEETIPVKISQLDEMMMTCGELVVLRNRLSYLVSALGHLEIHSHLKRRLNDMAIGQNKTIDIFQKQLINIRKVSLQKTLAKIVRVIREASRDQEKLVDYQHGNLNLGVDKTIANALSLSLTHMVRNCIGHGIEYPKVRLSKGKPERGTIRLDIQEISGFIIATLNDDGAGIDVRAIRQKVVDRALVNANEISSLSDEEVIQYVFEPGFSTAKQVDSISGRGVGMDVVRTAATSLGGDVLIKSVWGEGTTITIRIPILRTIMVESTIIVKVNKTSLSVPVKFIDKILSRNDVGAIKSFQSSLFFTYGTHVLECIFAEDLIGPKTKRSSRENLSRLENIKNVLILVKDKKHLAIAVDQICGQFASVVRPFDKYFEFAGFSGTTLLDDDSFAYVLGEALFDEESEVPENSLFSDLSA